MRVDCTRNDCSTYKELAEKLKAAGFVVDHFHAVVKVETDPGVFDPSDHDQWVELVDGKLVYYRNHPYHIQVESGFDWSGFAQQQSCVDDPRTLHRLFADTKHKR